MEKVIAKKDWLSFLAHIGKKRTLIGPVSKGNDFVFAKVDDPAKITLPYVPTILPPQKALVPQKEALLKFELGKEHKVFAEVEAEPQVLVGVHPCDINALWVIDQAFTKEYVDYNYLKRKELTTIIGLNCNEPCDDKSFCYDMGSLKAEENYDIMLTDIGDSYFMEVATPKGEELISGFSGVKDPTTAEKERLSEVEEEKKKKFNYRLKVKREEIPGLLERSYYSLIWDALGDRCLGCGTCTLVCPTCYCFNIEDKLDITLKTGERIRVWDSCQLESFAKVATGENFRESRAARQRHRVFRKGKYLVERFGKFGCVGCGRCVRQCVVNIDIRDIFNQLKGVK